MRKRVLVTGASGFVGKNLMSELSDKFVVSGTYYSRKKQGLHYLDITDEGSVGAVFAEIKPGVVIHAAALPNVNYCEINKPLAKKINLDGTRNIIRACKQHGAKLIFISTDYIFDGKDGPYAEDGNANPLNYYGKLKLLAEEEIKRELEGYIIVRTTNIYGYDPESKNFVMSVLEKLRNGTQVLAAIDQYGNPTYAADLGKAIGELIIKNKSGIYNVAGPDNINRLEFAQKIAVVWGYDKGLITGKLTEELKQEAPRPKKSGFIIEKIRKELDTKMLGVEEGLKLMKNKMSGGVQHETAK